MRLFRRFSLLCWLFAAIVLPFPSPHNRCLLADNTAAKPEDLLRSLQELQFDTDRTMTVKDLSLHFESVFLTFDRGRMVFTRPVAGVVTGLYYWGEGTIVASPASIIEKQQLNLFTGTPTLNEHFREAYIRFTDGTYDLLMDQAKAGSETEILPIDLPADGLQRVLQLKTTDSFRILADLLNGRTMPIFSARLRGQKLGFFDFVVDYRRKEQISFGQNHIEPGHSGYDVWCSYPLNSRIPRGFGTGRGAGRDQEITFGGDTLGESVKLIDSQSYEIETNIDKDDHLTGTTRLEFVGEMDGEWVLLFDLSRYLKLSKLSDDKHRVLLFYQNNMATTEEEMERLGQDLVMVLLKEPLRAGEKRTLEFEYSGDVISRVGTGIFYVGSRGSWYPNTGILDRAKYKMKFQYPKPLTIVATGDLVKEWEEGDFKNSLWKSEIPIPIAGFNYGDYIKRSTTANNIPIDVYTNRSVESVYLEIKNQLEVLRELEQQRQMSQHRSGGPGPEFSPVIPTLADFDTNRFSGDIVSRVAQTLQFYEPLLTKYPYNKLAVSQIPGSFSQGWPSLLYVSSLAFLSREQRTKLGMETDRDALAMECLHAHELAHQWWGNLVGWKSYHDVWMMEGFSNYLGFLAIKLRYPTEKQLRELLHRAKERILSKNPEGQTIESAGPVWLSSRLASTKYPDGYMVLAYDKGAWILHMLRCLLTDPNTGSDRRFQLMITDFLTTYRDNLASTEDFKSIVEKHMGKELDLEGNRRMDWFFDEWVYRTGVPTYRINYSTSQLKNGTFLVKGKISQESVSDLFMMPVEVFAHFPQQKVLRVGQVNTTGSETPFRFVLKSKPVKLTLDENHAILCENKTL